MFSYEALNVSSTPCKEFIIKETKKSITLIIRLEFNLTLLRVKCQGK